MSLPGVYETTLKDGTPSFRASITSVSYTHLTLPTSLIV